MRTLLLDLRRELLAAVGAAALLPACSGDDGTASASNTDAMTSGESTTDSTTSASATATTTDATATATGTASATGTAGTTSATTDATTATTTDATSTSTSTTDATSSSTNATSSSTDATSSSTDATSSTTNDGTTGGSDCDPPPTPPEGFQQAYACFPLPDGLATCDECVDECLTPKVDAAITMDPNFCSTQGLLIQCGPDPDAEPGMCCYYAAHLGVVCEGRPLVVDGEIRAAPLCARRDWLAPITPAPVDALDPTTRAALADAWAEDARMEHASIAAFARLVLHLMAHGAPAELVAATGAALADEVEHARACFAIASDLAGAPRGPGALSITGAVDRTPTLTELAVAAVLEGCVGETLAAAIARVSAATASAPLVRPHLEAIAADESRHAALSWRIVRWAIERGGAPVRAAVADAFAVALARPPSARTIAADVDPAAWAAHGRLSAADESAVLRDTLRAVITPCARALVGGSATANEAHAAVEARA